MARDFYLVQRLRHAPYDHFTRVFPQAKVQSNPFGYGRMGDYELDYMGSAEFEFGTIPKANNRLAEAGDTLTLSVHEYKGKEIIFLYIEEEGDPFDDWVKWIESGAKGKQRPHDFLAKLNDDEDSSRFDSVVWWSLRDNVMWSFREDGKSHLEDMLESMKTKPVEFLR